MNEYAQKLLKEFLRENSELDFKISANTELYRKGFGRIFLENTDKTPVTEPARISFRQTGHEYHFGANLFMLEQFPEAEKNALFEKRFTDIFNLGVVPLYWSDYEPEEGKTRYRKDSPNIYRRPAPDLVLDFCDKHNITPKGHPLFWHGWIPNWMPTDRREWLYRFEKHIAEIAENYIDRIHIFDAINEVFTTLGQSKTPYIEDILPMAFKIVDKHFPTAQLVFNDDMWWWNYHRELTPYYLAAKDLVSKGLRVGGLGFQYHMFSWNIKNAADKFLDPVHLYRCLEQYSKLGIPCSLSEISLISSRDLGNGDMFQNILLEKLYRLWFSHPATEALIYWNIVDGTAADGALGGEDGENSLRSGLLNYDLSPKPAYDTLNKLVNREWNSSGEIPYQPDGDNRFHGFFGEYELDIELPEKTVHKKIKLSKYAQTDFHICIS